MGETAGTFTDERDGQTYRTVKMPDGKVWMAENLRFKIGEGWCYGDIEDFCKIYGRLYSWDEAIRACPKGWHLPSKTEWEDLVIAVGSLTGGKKLKSKSGWNRNGNGTDDYGFSALPGGCRSSDCGFDYAGYHGYWWTATEGDGSYAYRRYVYYCLGSVDEYGYSKSGGFSVRCVKDT
jgi:uncharacterized protein (TIGR02145 family)